MQVWEINVIKMCAFLEKTQDTFSFIGGEVHFL